MLPCIFTLWPKGPRPSPVLFLRRSLRTRALPAGPCRHALADGLADENGSTTATDLDTRPSPGEQSGRQRTRALKSPSPALQAALGLHGLGHLIEAPPAHKVDLSNINITKHDSGAMQEHLRRKAEDLATSEEHMRLSPVLIVARVVRTQPTKDVFGVVDLSLSQEELVYLSSRGWNEEDVRLWVHILTASDVAIAARSLRVGSMADQSGGSAQRRIPLAVLLAFLRRPSLTSLALKDSILSAWTQAHRLTELQNSAAKHPEFEQTTGHAWFMLIVRLVRHARQVWPDALVTIAAMFVHFFDTSVTRSHDAIPRQQAKLRRLSYLSNKALKLLALPSSSTPFLALPSHERAQFDILGWMAGHDPPLTISREGYRAIISVQLAHRKTFQEQDWSQLKAKSWPPWKEEKTGLDADKGVDYGRSRALQAVNRAAEAGYGGRAWERSAQILAGWDVDMSPTIQTRAFMLHKYFSYPRTAPPAWSREQDAAVADKNTQPMLWSARIAATRTTQEAWACFLEHKDQNLAPNRMVYDKMLQKLIASEMPPNNRRSNVEEGARPLEPGDFKEVLPTPTSPKEMTYVHTETPTADQFALDMRIEGMKIYDDTLALLISRAKTIELGLKYASWRTQPLGRSAVDTTRMEGDLKHLVSQRLPGPVFRAIVELFCAHPSAKMITRITRPWLAREARGETAFAVAVRLVKSRQEPKSRQKALGLVLAALKSWKHLSTTDTVLPNGELDPSSWIRRYRLAQDVLHSCGVDQIPDGSSKVYAHTYLTLLERAVNGALEIRAVEQSSSQSDLGQEDDGTTFSSCPKSFQLGINEILSTDLAYIQSFLPTATGVDLRSDVLLETGMPLGVLGTFPRLLSTPDPAKLHIIVRILGALQDYDGILSLLEWMVQNETEVRAAAGEPRSGLLMLKRCLVAARIYFERPWEEPDENGSEATLDERARLVRLAGSTTLFGDWPDDEAMWRYIERGRKSQQAPDLYQGTQQSR